MLGHRLRGYSVDMSSAMKADVVQELDDHCLEALLQVSPNVLENERRREQELWLAALSVACCVGRSWQS